MRREKHRAHGPTVGVIGVAWRGVPVAMRHLAKVDRGDLARPHFSPVNASPSQAATKVVAEHRISLAIFTLQAFSCFVLGPCIMLAINALRTQFEQAIVSATLPVNGQYPRPWMTDLNDPLEALAFVVGRNPARTYPAARLSHARHVDALFNRNGQYCRAVYDELNEPSRTRENIDRFGVLLRQAGVDRILETNVICYSSPMSADLALPEHSDGRSAGRAVFSLLLRSIRPRVLIAHGAGTVHDLSKMMGASLPAPAQRPGPPPSVVLGTMTIITLPSLALPAWNRWHSWADEHLKSAAAIAAVALQQGAWSAAVLAEAPA